MSKLTLLIVFSFLISIGQCVFANQDINRERLIEPVQEPNIESQSLTTTYVRCWYRQSDSHDDVKTAWKWALTEEGAYYQIHGYWHSNEVLKNMFFTDTSQDEIREVCQRTIKPSHEKVDMTFFAADSFASFNYTIWTNDPLNNSKEKKINKIISFGDSLSDTGNVFNGSNWLFPNRNSWFLGRFSNGLLWTEYLAKTMNVPVYNWAIGVSASTDQYFFLKGIKSQILSYNNYMKSTKNYHPENTLFTLEFGINDFLLFNTPLDEVKQHFDETLALLVKSNVKHLVVMLEPDASRIPGYKKVDPKQAAALRKNIIGYNDHIKEKIAQYKGQGLHIITFDVFGLLEQLIANPQKYGFDNATDACLDIEKTDTYVYFSSYNLTDDCKKIGSDKYVFWGNTHPTTMAHKYFSDHLIKKTMVSFDFSSMKFLVGERHFHDRHNQPVRFSGWDGRNE